MLKIWAKTIKEDKIKKDMIYKRGEKYSNSNFMDYLVEICHEFDIPTPVVLKKHTNNFDQFNITRFSASDFIESVGEEFDYLVLENAGE